MSGRIVHHFWKKHPREYQAWVRMKTRCYNKNGKDYADYGGRGISVCGRWHNSFENFFEDMGPRPSPRHSLDRYPNNDGNYEPGNCRWATMAQQRRNARGNHFISFGGRTMTIADWADATGLPDSIIRNRIQIGWSPEDALTIRPQKRPLRLTVNGETKTIPEWSKATGLSRAVIRRRISAGWDAVTIVTAPIKKGDYRPKRMRN